jgi:hypothetical protein
MNNLKTKTGYQYKIDKLIFVFASLYLMTTVGWFWKQKQHSEILTNRAQNKNNPTTVNNNQPSTNYQQQINTSELNNQTLKTSKPLSLVSSIPLPVVEEISSTKTLNKIEPIPLPPPPPSDNLIQNPQDISLPSAPKKIISSPKKLNKVPTLSTLNSTTVEEVAVNNIPLTSSSTSTTNIGNTEYKYSLIGIVQLPEDKSFALFDINDITEKVSVGTEIGTTGWVLMAVNGKQVTVSRQNKSINLRVGETF